MSSTSERYVVGGINVFKCNKCGKKDPKGFAFVPITLLMLAQIRSRGRGLINCRCKRGHSVSFVLRTATPGSAKAQPIAFQVT